MEKNNDIQNRHLRKLLTENFMNKQKIIDIPDSHVYLGNFLGENHQWALHMDNSSLNDVVYDKRGWEEKREHKWFSDNFMPYLWDLVKVGYSQLNTLNCNFWDYNSKHKTTVIQGPENPVKFEDLPIMLLNDERGEMNIVLDSAADRYIDKICRETDDNSKEHRPAYIFLIVEENLADRAGTVLANHFSADKFKFEKTENASMLEVMTLQEKIDKVGREMMYIGEFLGPTGHKFLDYGYNDGGWPDRNNIYEKVYDKILFEYVKKLELISENKIIGEFKGNSGAMGGEVYTNSFEPRISIDDGQGIIQLTFEGCKHGIGGAPPYCSIKTPKYFAQRASIYLAKYFNTNEFRFENYSNYSFEDAIMLQKRIHKDKIKKEVNKT